MRVPGQFWSGDHRGRRTASADNVTRRSVLKAGAAIGGGLLIGVQFARVGHAEQAPAGGEFMPNAFIRIEPSGAISLIMNQVEMGQGTYTSLPMLIAEELEVDLQQVRIEHAPPDERRYANPILQLQATGGSTSVRGYWKPLREAGAAARVMLIGAAAKTWQVRAEECRAINAEVVHAPSGRRLSYGALAAGAAQEALPESVPLKDPKDFRLIGTSARRTDTPAKVDGSAKFGIDAWLPGMRFATVSICPHIGGSLKAVDERAALRVPGVRQVVRLDSAVAVVGDHMGAAKKGLAALKIDWLPGESTHFSSEDLVKDLRLAAARTGAVAESHGDVGAAIGNATRTVEAEYEMPLLAHAPMEPMNCTVHVRPDSCDVWVGTQVAARAQAAAASVTGLSLEKIRVHNHLIGGGFGRRLEIDGITLATQVARQVQGPVKVVWTREQDIQHDVYRPYYFDRMTAALDGEGKPTALIHRVVGSSIYARWLPVMFKGDLDIDAVDNAAGPYSFENLHVDYVRRELPQGLQTGWWRGVGSTHNGFVVEGFIDELAATVRADPVEYRRALLGPSPRARAVLDIVAEMAEWGAPLPERTGRGVAVIAAFGSYIAQVAQVHVSTEGEVEVQRVACAVDCGRIINPDTVRAQMEGGIIFGISAALYGEITLKDGQVEQSNFHDYRVLRMNETPKIEVRLVSSGEEPGGIGEPGTSALAPAVVNAIFAATGKRLRKLPVKDNVLKV